MKNKIICGEALTELKKLPDECIDCVVTSPPYFNLRSYLDNNHPDKKLELGLEKTYQEYIKKLIDIFNEAKRVLKKEGTCFVNLGDSYSSIGKLCGDFTRDDKDKKWGKHDSNRGRSRIQKGTYSEKCLMLIPERFSMAMIDNNWILRNKLVWIKPNAMPESVQDRWKKAHEYIFFFSKSKKYNFNLDAIRTPHKQVSIKRAEYEQGRNALGLNPSSMGKKYNRDKKNKDGTEKYYSMPARTVKLNPKGACPPDYFLVNTNCSEQDTVEGHYATYPQQLIAPLIQAGCPKDGIVLDPFAGSFTTALVAKKLRRNYIMIELSPEYIKIGKQRLRQDILI